MSNPEKTISRYMLIFDIASKTATKSSGIERIIDLPNSIKLELAENHAIASANMRKDQAIAAP